MLRIARYVHAKHATPRETERDPRERGSTHESHCTGPAPLCMAARKRSVRDRYARHGCGTRRVHVNTGSHLIIAGKPFVRRVSRVQILCEPAVGRGVAGRCALARRRRWWRRDGRWTMGDGCLCRRGRRRGHGRGSARGDGDGGGSRGEGGALQIDGGALLLEEGRPKDRPMGLGRPQGRS